MTQNENKTNMSTEATPVHKSYPVNEIAQKYYQEEKKQQAVSFDEIKKKLMLLHLKEGERRTFNIFDKEKLRRYVRNPLKSEAELRELSQFLYRLSYPYRRIIQYYAGMIDLSAMICVPKIDMLKEPDKKKVMKDYSKVLVQHQKMNMVFQIFKLMVIAWREDAVFAYAYEDNDGFFLLPLDGRYCKISSLNSDGTFNFVFDFSYFRNRLHLLEYWDKEFYEKYQLYLNDTTGWYRWQELDPKRTFCIKINIDDPLLCLPPFLPLFEAIIDLIDLQSLQAVKDSLSVYKLLVMREETIERATEPDQFTVDLDSAVAYWNKLAEVLPPEVTSVLSLLPIDVIDFKGDTTEDVDMISNSMSNLFKNAGVSQILDRNKIEGAVAFTAAMLSDSVLSTSNVLPQIEAWVNRYIKYKLGNVTSHVKYLPVTPYTKADYLNKVTNAAQYGVPVKLQTAALLNTNPYEAYAMEYLENDVLNLVEEWKPLSSSFTQSGGNTSSVGNPLGGGRPVTTGDDSSTSETRQETRTTSTTSTSNGTTTSSSSTTTTSGSTG